MKPYTPHSKKGLSLAVDDIHHKTSDAGTANARKANAKKARHAARQQGHKLIRSALQEVQRHTISDAQLLSIGQKHGSGSAAVYRACLEAGMCEEEANDKSIDILAEMEHLDDLNTIHMLGSQDNPYLDMYHEIMGKVVEAMVLPERYFRRVSAYA